MSNVAIPTTGGIFDFKVIPATQYTPEQYTYHLLDPEGNELCKASRVWDTKLEVLQQQVKHFPAFKIPEQ